MKPWDVNDPAMLANAAVVQDGVELDFRGDKCGHSYRIRRNGAECWESFFYSWHDGWLTISRWPGAQKRAEAIYLCNQHAVEKRLIKFLPNRPKFKPNPNLGGLAAAASTVASVAGFSI